MTKKAKNLGQQQPVEETMPVEETPVEATEVQREVPEALAALQKELDECRAKTDEYLDGWQRSRAEFANYKKRIERDQVQAYQTAAGSVIKQFLDVLDDLDRALKSRPVEGEGAVWAAGIDLIYRKLVTILDGQGVKIMETEGQYFDPNLHDALTSEDCSEMESGQIISVVQQGYMLGDRVLRPARVRVAK